MEGPTIEPEETQKPPPAIRTMQSDVAEYLKATKPSLASLAASEAKANPAPFILASPRVRRGLLFGLGGLLLAMLLGAGGYSAWWWLNGSSPISIPTETPPPTGMIAFDRTEEAAIELDRNAFASALTRVSEKPSPEGAFTRIVIRTSRDGAGARHLALSELVALLGAEPASGFAESAGGLPQFFIYQSLLGPRAGLIVPVRQASRALQSLLTWEPNMARDGEPLLLGAPIPLDGAFADSAYRNIDYRFFRFAEGDDLGIGYLYFPAKGLIVIATSDGTIRATVDRLFERR